MKPTRRLVAAAAVALACTANAATPTATPKRLDDRRMSTVYVLAQAGAILDLCLASPERAGFPEAKAKELAALAARLTAMVQSIGTYYRDRELVGIYESTKANMAADTQLRFHVKNNHQNCGERTVGDMRAYVADNEALIGGFIEKKRLEAPPAAPKK
jgi:type IV pilus biogenesis protein CpaD/CtpE